MMLRCWVLVVACLLATESVAFAQMRKIYELPPVPYPEDCLARHIEGTVVLRFLVSPAGKIHDIKVSREVSECPQFTTAALAAVRRAQVYPLPEGTRLLRQSIEVPITFSITQNEF